MGGLFSGLAQLGPADTRRGSGTLALILGIRSYIPVIPWGIASIAVATLVCYLFHLPVETIVPVTEKFLRTLPFPAWPSFSFHFDQLGTLVPDAITIAILAGIESLLSAVVADGMTGAPPQIQCGTHGARDCQSRALSFLGGCPLLGAIARTATNIKAGAQTPVAGMIHAVDLFCIILALPPSSAHSSRRSSAVLIMVAWNMSEISHFPPSFQCPGSRYRCLTLRFFADGPRRFDRGCRSGNDPRCISLLRRMMQ